MRRDGDTFDGRALRFAIGFPVALAVAFVAITWLLRGRLPAPMALHWSGGRPDWFTGLPALLTIAGTGIAAGGAILMVLGAVRWKSVALGRVLMGAGMGAALFLTAVFGSVVVGQLDVADAKDATMDGIVFAMGSGAALALGVTMGFVYKPLPRWTERDEEAVRLAAEPALAESLATLSFWVHTRSTVYTLLVMIGISVGSLTALLAWWLGLLVLVLAVLTIGFFTARVKADRLSMSLSLAGFVRVARVSTAEVTRVETRYLNARDYGGWGYRSSARSVSYLLGSGPGLVVRRKNGPDFVLGTGTEERAAELAAFLLRLPPFPPR